MITSKSRYSDSDLELIASGRGTNLTVVPSQQQEWRFNYTYHLVDGSDRLDLLAQQYFGDPTLWWNIADANPEIIDWTVLIPGTTIRIPSA